MPPPNKTLTPTEIKSAYAEALHLIADARPDAALQRLGHIVETNPNIAEVQFQIGRIFTTGDRYDRALSHLQAAAALKPKEPAIWAALAAAVALAGDADSQKACLAALKSAPIAPELRIRLQNRFGAQKAASKPALGGADAKAIAALVALMSARRFAEAEAGARTLLLRHPGAAIAANIRASALAALGRHPEALTAFHDAIRIDPFYAEAHANLGHLLQDMGRLDAAKAAFRDAVACAPAMAGALTELARLQTRSGSPERALPLLERALKAAPNSVAALTARGNALTRLRDYAAAETALLRAVKAAGGKSAEALALLAQAQAHLGKDDEALRNYDAALAVDANHAAAQGGKAGLLQNLGRFDEAEIWFRKVFETDPTNGENYRLFIASHKCRPGDPIIAQMLARFDDPALGDTDRMNLGFAIAKALEDVRDYDKVFTYLNAANSLLRKAFPYDIAQRQREVAAVQAAMAGFDWQAAQVPGTSDYAPIFVTGMPRSGTTLVEQIIASHSQVEGAGEMGDGTRIAQRLLFEGADGPCSMTSLTAGQIAGLGRDYEALLRSRFPDAPHVTDKSILTYLFIGLMKLALPRARIIVVRRDPRDTLLSIYKNKFPEGTHLYGSDLTDLAHYYTSFVQMIEFWRALVPDWFYEVEYEALVANPEAESRKLIAACGLEWQDACLNFHQNTRKVETLSVYQVRQPISGGSVKSWQRYGAEIAPLLAALKEDGHVLD
ncbi:MAG: sulfotransferase [Pseudorhodobacter sp.]|nr:sulfotransferase [Pseudorhodobacter sp.]